MLLWLQYLKQLELACASVAELPRGGVQDVKTMCEDEEWGDENEAMAAEQRSPPSPAGSRASPRAASPAAPSPPPAASPPSPPTPPRLRLNTSLATDPALLPHAAALKREAPSPSPPTAPLPAPPTARDFLALTAAFPALFPPGAPAYVCAPCGIRYSSPSTLQAHRDHYCSHRPTKPAFDGRSDTPSADGNADESGGETPAKTPRPGKQYACTYCSYSADKKVSLNRHMRMHSASPSPSAASTPAPQSNGDATDPPAPQDRYCTDCDIRFSSIKTYRAHKAHYCSTRQVLKQTAGRGGSSGTSGSAPNSPRGTPPSPAASGQQFALALPTNPILIVPYSLLRGASTLPGATLPDPDAPCFLLPNGTIQPMSRALAAAVAAESKDSEVLKAANRPRDTTRDAAPLDLSVRRSPIPATPDLDDHEKENRLRTATPEQIVCAPSLPASPATPSPSPRRSLSPGGESSPKRQKRRDSRGPTTPKPPSVPSPPDQKFGPQLPAAMLPPALALRLAAESSAPSQPQVLVKQGVSKCKECNIVFCKYENYRIHKQHYCSAGSGEERASPAPEAGPPAQYRQLICLACGIKFSSLDNLATHQSYYCLKRESRSPRTEAPRGEAGWRCPCCEVVSPTAAAAQRHMEAHAGVKAFRCTICRYRGNTLRGMRTHIRMHFPKKPADLQEESYIACVVEDENRESTSPGAAAAPGERVHRCTSCAYTSTYRGNVVRHARLVHAIDEPETEEPLKVEPQPQPDIKKEPIEEENEQRDPNVNYCKSCDISFKYLNTYKAHKQFYCPQEAAANNNVPAPPNVRVTDTPV